MNTLACLRILIQEAKTRVGRFAAIKMKSPIYWQRGDRANAIIASKNDATRLRSSS